MKTAKLSAGLVLIGALLVGCSDEPPAENCPARAAFHVTVRANPGPLPLQTAITVAHGGGSEEFRLDAMMETEILFCEPLYDDADASADAGSKQSVRGVSCELWTQGATAVTVQAPGYPLLEKELAVETDEGCIQTVPVELLLAAGDAATKD